MNTRRQLNFEPLYAEMDWVICSLIQENVFLVLRCPTIDPSPVAFYLIVLNAGLL